jgi:hypothetical protein
MAAFVFSNQLMSAAVSTSAPPQEERRGQGCREPGGLAGTLPAMASRAAFLFGVLALALFVGACANTECNFNSQCGPRRYCFSGSCRQDCRLDLDCASGQVCSLVGRCEEPTDAGPPPLDQGPPPADLGPPRDFGPMPVDLGPADLGRSDLGPPPVDLGPADLGPPPDLGGPRLAYLEDCTSDAQCESGRCVGDASGSARVCSKTCTDDAQCADWHFCVQSTPGTPGYCAGDDTGRLCTNATADTCAFACLSPDATNPGHCTHLCRTAADCPGGYGCVFSVAGDASSLKVCAWTNRDCPGDALQCATSLGVCGGAGTWCTGHCASNADCPRILGTPAACADSNMLGFNVCEPPLTGGVAPLGTPCSTDLDCRSGICAVPEMGGTQICLERCIPTSGCPVGFGCNAVSLPRAGIAANICVPAGLGRSGAACMRGQQCRSGVCSSRSARCIDSCQNGFCPPGTVCTPEGLTVEGIPLSSCR